MQLNNINREHFFEWLRSTGQLDLWDAMADISQEPFDTNARRAHDDMSMMVKRYNRIQELDTIDWSGDHAWLLAFVNHVRKNQQVQTKNGLVSEDELLWIIDMFDAWARNQNTTRVPHDIMKEYMKPCTEDIGCVLRAMVDCPVCSHLTKTKVEVSKHEYHIMETEDGPHGSDWSTYRRNGPGNWEVLMGESWEACHGEYEIALEEIFQRTLDI